MRDDMVASFRLVVDDMDVGFAGRSFVNSFEFMAHSVFNSS